MRRQTYAIALAGFGALCLAGSLLARPTLQGSFPRNQSTSHHGAASMDAQLVALEKLGLPAEAVTPPPGVDPYI